MSHLPIGDYAFLSDCNSAALVSRAGSVDWLCLPRFDSPSIFGRLLDADAGHWSITPAAGFTASRQYLARTLALETTFRTAGGTVVLAEALAAGVGEEGHQLGMHAPHALVRCLRCTEGEMTLDLELAPRPDYARQAATLARKDGRVEIVSGEETLCLSGEADFAVEGATVRARFTLRAGDHARFSLQYVKDGPARAWASGDIQEHFDSTLHAWRTWATMHQNYEGPWAEMVHHSGRVLQGLTYQPTGALVAAATTSLPEEIGGERNWDYRFTWVRDASITLEALWVAACPDEADRFVEFLAKVAERQLQQRGELQILFSITGDGDLSEQELTHLSGWRDSRPVRIGNGAWDQRQLDVYGELLNAVCLLRDHMGEIEGGGREFLATLADMAADRWEDRDNGIWEVRSDPQHFTHSKLMCWVAVDRAIRMADWLGANGKVEHWTTTRDAIRDAILERGWNPRVNAFTQAFGSDALDAAVLLIPIVGLLPGDDPKVQATIDTIREKLTDAHGLVYRYQAEDGLEGEEGTFLLCTFWLAQALAEAGRPEEATEVFERAAAFANDVGLLAEEVDPERRELLGNYPQAFSHIGLVNAAWAIHQARQGRSKRHHSPLEG